MRGALLPLAALAAACASNPAPPQPQAETKPPTHPARVVSATVVTNGCASLGAVNARLAEDAMNKLTEGCMSVPSGGARFVATLMPGGRIQIKEGPGQPEMVPTCVLKNELRHRVYLQKPCDLEVKLEESTVHLVLPEAGAPLDASTDAAKDH